MMRGIRLLAAQPRRPGVPAKSTLSPASSVRTVRMHSRISASVAGLRPMVLADV